MAWILIVVDVLTPGLLGEGGLVISWLLSHVVVEAVQLRSVKREMIRLSVDQAIRDHQAAQSRLHRGQVILKLQN